MPSFEHEALVQLFRNRPALAAELWSLVTGEPMPDFEVVDISDASLGELLPTERRPDQVVLLRGEDRIPVLGIVVEIQLGLDPDKKLVWPLYHASLAAREGCPVVLLVVCPDGAVAAWAQGVIEEQRRRPAALVIGPEVIPCLEELPEERRTPEMAVLAVKAHAHRPAGFQAAVTALAIMEGLPPDRFVVYFDMIVASLDAAARRALEELMQSGQYEFQSEFARRYYNQGIEEGRQEGRQEGEETARRELASKLLARGTAVAEVAELTGLPEEEVRQLRH